MAFNVIGFRGMDASDIILYLARILQNMQFKILLCDHSPEGKMAYYIPLHNALDLYNSGIDYKGIDFTRQGLSDRLIAHYDFVIVNYGFLEHPDKLGRCGRIVYLTDTDKAHMKMTGKLEAGGGNTENILIVRDYFKPVNLNLSLYKKELAEQLSIQMVYEIPLRAGDIKAQRMMQYNDAFRFTCISQKTVQFLFELIQGLLAASNCDRKKLAKAVKRAMKGD